MYIQISFPIVDIRPFVESATHQIQVPNWYTGGNTQNEFVRHFGHIRMTNQYVDHREPIPYAHSKGALKLPHLNEYNFLPGAGQKGSIQSPYPYRRLFVKPRRKKLSPFSCEARFDFGIKIKPSGPDLFDLPDLIDAQGSIHSVIKKFLEFPVSVGIVKGKKRNVDLALGQIGPSIANLYLYSSSQLENRSQVKKYWVNALQPTILLQLQKKKSIQVAFIENIDPNKIIQQFSNDDFQLLQFEYEAFGNTIPVWLMIRNNSSSLTQMNEQLIAWNIIKLHSEYQTIVNLSQLVINDRLNFTPRSEASQRFQFFINEILTQLDPKSNVVTHKTIFQRLAQNHYELIKAEDCLKLIQNLSHIRKNVLRKLGNFNLSKNPHEPTPIERIADKNHPKQLTGIKQAYLDKASPFVQHKDIEAFENHVRILISRGELEETLEIMRAFLTLSNIKGPSLDTVTLQLFRFNTEKRAANQGTITRENYMVTRLQISQAILNSFEEIKAG